MVVAANDTPLHALGGIGLENAANNYMQSRKDDAAIALSEEQKIGKKIENMSDRDKRRLESLVLASAELKPYLDSGDIDGAKKALQSRRSWLGGRIAAGEDVDTRETDEALAMLDTSPQQLKAIVDQTFQLGNTLGIFQKQGNIAGGDTGVLLDRLVAEGKKTNPNYTLHNALEDLKGGAGQAGKNAANISTGREANFETGAGDILGRQSAEFGNLGGPSKADVARQVKTAENFGGKQGEAIFDLPRTRAAAAEALTAIDSAIASPGLKNITGWMHLVPITPGGERARAEALLDQVQGRQFLAAYEMLKGGGAISEVEGGKGETAIAALGRAQNAEDVKKALGDLRNVVIRSVQSKEQSATQTPQQIQQNTFNPPMLPNDSALPVVDGNGPAMRLPGSNTPVKGRVRILGIHE